MKITYKNFGIFLIIAILFVSFASAYRTTYDAYSSFTTGSSYSTITSTFDQSMCTEGSDFIIQISPTGCSPSVVTSDLLEEQSVPVYCQLQATQINPLIDVEAIDSITFSGQTPSEVATIGFHPAQAALGVDGDLNNPVLENIGYAVIVLKQQPDESALTNCEKTALGTEVCWVEGNLTAKLRYDVQNAFGIGAGTYYLPVLEDDEWEDKYTQYGFWKGRGYLKAESVYDNNAKISVYSDQSLAISSSDSKQLVSTFSLGEGEVSSEVYLPNFDYCMGSLQIQLTDLVDPDTRAKLSVDGNVMEVTENEDFLDNKCIVKDITKNGLVQSVEVRCIEDEGSKKIDFSISPRVKLEFEGANEEGYVVGDQLYPIDEQGSKFVYLGYIGENSKGEKYIIPVVSPAIDSESFRQTPLYNQLPTLVKTLEFDSGNVLIDIVTAVVKSAGFSVTTIANFIDSGSYPTGILYEEGATQIEIKSESLILDLLTIVQDEITFSGFAEGMNQEMSDEMQTYYTEALENYDKVIEDYGSDVYPAGSTATVAENAFYSKITLANNLRQMRDVLEWCEQYESLYGEDSSYDLLARQGICKDEYKLANSENSVSNVEINGDVSEISFEGVYEPSEKEYGAVVSISGGQGNETISQVSKTIGKGVQYSLLNDDYFELVSVEDDSITIFFNVEETFGQGAASILKFSGKNTKIKEGSYVANVGEQKYKITVHEVNLEQQAKVKVIPNINNAWSETDFRFKIGVEKRAIDLAPETIEKLISNLDKSIETWESVTDVMGTTVSGLKTACLTYDAWLTVKNFVINSKGAGTARLLVMKGDEGWYEKCAIAVHEGEYSSDDVCLADNSKKIDAEVEAITELMSAQNEKISSLEKEAGTIKSELLSKNILNQEKFIKSYTEEIIENLAGVNGINMNTVKAALSLEGFAEGKFSQSDLEEIDLYLSLSKSGDENLVELADSRLETLLKTIESNAGNIEQVIALKENAKANGLGELTFEIVEDEKAKIGEYTGAIAEENAGDISKEEKIQGIIYNGNSYVVSLEPISENKYIIETVYDSADYKKVDETTSNKIKEYYSHFKGYDENSYKNTYKKAEIKYFEGGTTDGLPALVPFDLNNGWYVYVPSEEAYTDAGVIQYFYLGNVGKDGLEGYGIPSGDDDYQLIDTTVSQSYLNYPGLEEGDIIKLVSAAIEAIQDASNPKGDVVRISTSYGKFDIEIGAPAIDTTDVQCQDYMSPADCLKLFNVCDPVICPSSRCDLGGTYPVKDVIQTGIIGGVALCLPNYQEGIKIPVCLSGIHAGLQNFVSLQKDWRDCLEENLESGQTVGICDEIHSIYLCQFFWKEAIPLTETTFQKIIGALSNKNARGGGEYFDISTAWQGVKGSIDYFTQYYAENSFAAFKSRSTEDIGGEVCSVFISATYADEGTLLSNLVEADSPSQFTGWFSETEFTSATNPPISQYKTYYHIYAGEDSGAYYKVYLKSSAGSSYYQYTSASYPVDSGYVTEGDYASETVDFTAPAGYDQLCIVVNNQEECGFSQVTTSFAANYLEDVYTSKQANETDIKTTKDCIGDTNVQIVRLCSTANPGIGTDLEVNNENPRWVSVGYCDEESLVCWLDTESVEDAIYASDLENETLGSVTSNYLETLLESGNYLDEKEFNDFVGSLENKESLGKLEMISNIFGQVFYNNQKAYLYYLRGGVYSKLAGKAKIAYDEEQKEASETLINLDSETNLSSSDVKDFSTSFYDTITNGPVFLYNDGTADVDLYYKFEEGVWKSAYASDGSWFTSPEIPFVEASVDYDSAGNPILEDAQYPDEEHQVFITSLEDKTYSQGLKSLVDRTLNEKGNIFVDPSLVSNEAIFYHNGYWEIKNYEKLFYGIYYGGEWQFAYTKSEIGYEDYFGIFEETDSEGNIFINDLGILYDEIEGFSLYEGARILFGGYSTEEVISEKESPSSEIVIDESANVSTTYQVRYAPYATYFENAATKNLPTGAGLSVYEFQALLVAVAQKETSLGSEDICGKNSDEACIDWLMGYTNGNNYDGIYRGAENQIDWASFTLKKAFEKNSEYYAVCDDEDSVEKQIECILSVYNTGKPPKKTWYTLWIGSNAGAKYAADVIEYWDDWKSYFNFVPSDALTADSRNLAIDAFETILHIRSSDTSSVAYEPIIIKTEPVMIDSSSSEAVIDTSLVTATFLGGEEASATQCVEEPEAICTELSIVSSEEDTTIFDLEQSSIDTILSIDVLLEESGIDSASVSFVQQGVVERDGSVNLTEVTPIIQVIDEEGEPVTDIEVVVQDTTGNVIADSITNDFGQIPLTNFEEEALSEEEIPVAEKTEIEQRIQNLIEGTVSTKIIGEGYFCAGYVSKTFDYVFGRGKKYLSGVKGNAWDFAENMIALGGSRIYDGRSASEDFTDYESLKVGDILGFKKYSNQPIRRFLRDLSYDSQQASNAAGEGYSHVGLYLGKINGKHMIAHQIGDIVYVHSINSFIYKRGDWSIYTVLRADQEKLYISSEEYISENNLVAQEYTVKSGDTLLKVAASFTTNTKSLGATQWIFVDQIGRTTLYLGEKISLYIPSSDTMESEEKFESEIVAPDFASTPLLQGLKYLYNLHKSSPSSYGRFSLENILEWNSAIENAFEENAFEKTPENYATVLAILEKESSFNENPSLDMEAVCENVDSFLAKMWCRLNGGSVSKIKTEKDYVLYGPNGVKPLSSAGAMQVSLGLAESFAEQNGESYSEEEDLYEYLFTKEGGVKYGVQYLKSIIEVYAKEGLDSENIYFVFADYNSGLYKSRNAAFQKQLNKILQEKQDLGMHKDLEFLDTDGYLGEATADLIKEIYGIELSIENGKIKYSDEVSFEITEIYNKVSPEEYAIIPNVELTSVKYGKDVILSVQNYAANGKKYFDRYCSLMDDCSLD